MFDNGSLCHRRPACLRARVTDGLQSLFWAILEAADESTAEPHTGAVSTAS